MNNWQVIQHLKVLIVAIAEILVLYLIIYNYIIDMIKVIMQQLNT